MGASTLALHARDAGSSLWTVELRDSGEVVGDVGLQHEDHGWGPEIGIGGRGSRAFCHQQRLLERLGMRRVTENPDGWPVYAVTRDELLAHTR